MNAEQNLGVLEEVLSERARQETRRGIQDHPMPLYFTILSEEVGEVARAILECDRGLRQELIQVAAVAVAMVEAIDRNKSEMPHAER